jgi:hypothetical protein
VASATKISEIPTETKELQRLVDRARNGDVSALPAVRLLLQEASSVEEFSANLAIQTEETLIAAAAGKDLFYKEALRRKQQLMRAELAGPTPTPLEKLLVERIVTCWLQLQDADIRFAQAKELTINQADYHQRRIDRAHKRFLSAVKTLATVRRLAVPVLIGQVNIAGKQVNKATTALPTILPNVTDRVTTG